MLKRAISLILCSALVLSIACFSSFADESNSYDTCTHEWEQPIDHWYGIPIPGTDITFGVDVERCSKCGLYKHTADLLVLKSTYYSPLPPHLDGIVPSELITYWLNVWYNFCGKNATPTKIPSGIGRKDLPGYADDNGTPSVAPDGNLYLVVYPSISIDSAETYLNYPASSRVTGTNGYYDINGLNLTFHSVSQYSQQFLIYYKYVFNAPIDGLYYFSSDQTLISNILSNDGTYLSMPKSGGSFSRNLKIGNSSSFYGNSQVIRPYVLPSVPSYVLHFHPAIVTCVPNVPTINQQTNITINNNTWNGNIYTDNSTNLTYIYPQYTTINEKNETVTNISNTPIIYNNETKQYYTYDQTTKNYYYITYNSDPAPSPTPTPDPTDKPGGDISTPETGKPGGSSGSSWWDKLLDKLGNAVIDGLLGAVSAVLKLIFKLLSTILGWIIWAVSLVFTLFPFLPPGVGGLLVGGVVVCFIIGIIKFIRG